MNALDITKKAHRQIGKLNKNEMRAIYAALEALRNWPDCRDVKHVVNSNPKTYRLRIDLYRAFFTVEGGTITITEVKKRDEHTY